MTRLFLSPTTGELSAIISVPGSKSIANRALICAMLADGDSRLIGIPSGDDTNVIVSVLTELGMLTKIATNDVVVSGSRKVRLPGIVDAQLAGTSSRFLTALAALSESTTIIDGADALRTRPMSDLHVALGELGADVIPLGESGHLPVSVSIGQMVGGEISINGDVSSQFISALMLIAPVLPRGLSISVVGPLVSRSYVEMTARVMSEFGVPVVIEDSRITVNQSLYRACEYVIEPDYSSAAFPLAAIVLKPGEVRIPYLATSHLQGDSAIVVILEKMGVECSTDGDDIVVRRSASSVLKPLSMDMSDCSDLVPVVATVCAVIPGESHITGVGFIRNKESDRLGDLAAELSKAGAVCDVTDDGMVVRGGTPLHPAIFDTHHDHRLAMALSLLSLPTGECTINDPNVVSKSWPSFFTDMAPILGVSSLEN